MDIAVLSDIHSNYVALERCLEYAYSRGIGTFIFLGDYIGELAYPERTLHHLPPHRRITYIELLKSVLKLGGYFGLVCFAWGENCADEVDDWEFYQLRRRVGVAFTKERLIELFALHFEIIEIRKYRNGGPDTIQGLDFMWTCLFRI